MTDGGFAAERWRRMESLFAEALDLPAAERERFLAGACADDRHLEGELRRLLRAHEEAGGFLEELDMASVAGLLGEEAPGAPEAAATGPVASGAGDPADPRTIGRYHVLRRLGRGGMGVVYLARDPRLERDVALKVLSPALAQDEGWKRRLMEEARAASALDHVNVATVFEVDETVDGRPFIAMAAYEGETLRERLRRGPLPPREALEVARQVADALRAAHARGIVHRDVKPGNVILTPAGVAKVVDFGIAKVTGSTLTRPGTTLGTIAYMSPEQTSGTVVDARTDVWSLGVILYEMLTGRNPFALADDRAAIHAIRHDDPEPAERAAAGVPPELGRIVARCLRKDPAERYGDAAPLADDLRAAADGAGRSRRALAGAAVLLVLIAGGLAATLLVGERGATGPGEGVAAPGGTASAADGAGALAQPAAPAPLRVAVLPFDDFGATGDPSYFAAGLTEELTARLSMLAPLSVIARGSVLEYLRGGGTIREIGAELGLDAVLQGSVRVQSDSVRVAVTLVDSREAHALWAQVFDAPLDDMLGVQRDIGERVAAALPVDVDASGRRRLAEVGTEDPEAYAAYLRGRYFWNRRDPESLRLALGHFRAALAADPLYARAWAGMADTYDLLAGDALPSEEAAQLARAAAMRALELDDGLAEAHASLAAMLTAFDHDWEAAETHFQRALALNPNYVIAHQRYAALLASLGRTDEALASVRRALELDPLSSYARAGVGYFLYLDRRFDEAIDQLRTARSVDPSFGLTYINLGLAYLAAGRPDSAVATLETLDTLWTDAPVVVGLLGHAYARAGRRREAAAALDRLRALAEARPVPAFQFGVVHAGLGNEAAALAALDTAVSRRDGLVHFLAVDPLFDGLRDRPGFRRLVARLGLEG